MTKWKTPSAIRKMREEGKAKTSTRSSWTEKASGARRRLITFGRRMMDAGWRFLKGPVWWCIRKPLCSLIKSASALVLAFAGLYSLFSSFVSMSIGDQLHREPTSAPITITNTSSFFTLVSVEPSCLINDIRHVNRSMKEQQNNAHGYMDPIPELLRGNQDTVYCDRGQSDFYPIDYADVTITVSYRPALYLSHYRFSLPCFFPSKHSEARFIAVLTDEGKLKWLPYGLHDRPDPSLKPIPLNFPRTRLYDPNCPKWFSKSR